jgi:hypothetical protein
MLLVQVTFDSMSENKKVLSEETAYQ